MSGDVQLPARFNRFVIVVPRLNASVQSRTIIAIETLAIVGPFDSLDAATRYLNDAKPEMLCP